MEPNLQVVSESPEADEDRKWWKIILMAVLGAGASVGAFHYFNIFLINLNTSDFWLFVACFVLLLIFSLLEVLFVKGIWKIFFLGLFQTCVPLILFINRFATSNPNDVRILILGFLVGFYFVFLGMHRGRRLIQNAMKLRFFDVSRRTLPRVASGMLIVVSVVLYLSYFSWGVAPADVGMKITDGIVSDMKPFSGIIVPGTTIDPQQNMGDLIKSIALQKLESSKITVQDQNRSVQVTYASLPPDYQAKVLNDVISGINGGLQSQFSFFNSNQTVGAFVFGVANEYFAKFSSFLGPYASILVIAVLFFLAKGTLAVFYWLIEFLAFVLFKILVVFGFAYVNLETRTREFLLLS